MTREAEDQMLEDQRDTSQAHTEYVALEPDEQGEVRGISRRAARDARRRAESVAGHAEYALRLLKSVKGATPLEAQMLESARRELRLAAGQAMVDTAMERQARQPRARL